MIPEPAGQGARNWSGGEGVSEVAGGQGRVVTARASFMCFRALLLRSWDSLWFYLWTRVLLVKSNQATELVGEQRLSAQYTCLLFPMDPPAYSFTVAHESRIPVDPREVVSTTQGKGKLVVLSTTGWVGALVVLGAGPFRLNQNLFWGRKEAVVFEETLRNKEPYPSFLPQVFILH